jgi:excisionase family DNA binding protein
MTRASARSRNVIDTTTYHQTRRDAAEASKITPLFTTQEAAAVLGVGKRTLQELAATRKIAFIKIGRSVRFHTNDLIDFIESQKIKAQGWKGGMR